MSNDVCCNISYILPTKDTLIITRIKKKIKQNDEILFFNSNVNINSDVRHHINQAKYNKICVIFPSVKLNTNKLEHIHKYDFSTPLKIDQYITIFNKNRNELFDYNTFFNSNKINITNDIPYEEHHEQIDDKNIEEEIKDVIDVIEEKIITKKENIKNDVVIDCGHTINNRGKPIEFITLNSPRKKNISWIPFWEPLDLYASSRLRCKIHHDLFNKRKTHNSVIGFSNTSDYIIITQRVKTEQDLIELEREKKRGKTIIYDLVDKYYTEWFSKKLFNICDHVIVANHIQKILLEQYTHKPIHILQDSIDYYDDIKSEYIKWNNNISWFGNYTNIEPLTQIFNILSNLYNINVITQADKISKQKNINYIQWEYSSFINDLTKNSVCILSHGLKDLQKSNNKLLVSIANNVPVIGYQSISYRNILNECGLPEYYCYNINQIINCIENLKIDKNRKRYINKSKKYIIDNYNPLKIHKKLVNIIDKSPSFIKKNKKVVYTSNIGGYDCFNDGNLRNKEIDYIYFTDNRDIKSKTWDVIYVDNLYNNNNKTSKYYKILAHDMIHEYKSSIWIDSCIYDIKTDFEHYFHLLNKYDLVIHKHPDRNCIYKEAEACIKMKKDNKDIIENQIRDYKMIQYPKNNGLFWCGFMAKNHNKLFNFFELWWNEIQNYSKRDQLSFPVVFFKYNININMKLLDCHDYKKYFSWNGGHLK